MRAVTFQSIERTSSPGRYSRTSMNSMPCPLNVDLYSPTNVELMIFRVRSSMRRSFFKNSAESIPHGTSTDARMRWITSSVVISSASAS
jgi:hypothetical protein